MAGKRLSMRKIREILRLRWGEGLSLRQVAMSVGASPSTVHDFECRARAARLGWPEAEGLDEEDLEGMLFAPEGPPGERSGPDFEEVHRELRRKGVTLSLLWHEYKLSHPEDGYQYSRFCELYRRWREKVDVVMRQEHKAGDKVFVDWSGDGIEIVDRETGEVREAPVFVAALGASGYTYAEAAETEQLRDWVRCHVNAFEYFGGVPSAVVPDNTKTAVRRPSYYEPDLNPTYHDMARHYETAVLPARVRKPKDKAKVEGGVLLVQRWILARLRNHAFFSVAEANEAIFALLDELNGRPFQKMEGSRRSEFEAVDRPALKPLPGRRYEYAQWSSPKVNIDYHVVVEGHYYSVPYQLAHTRVEARYTSTTVEIFLKGRRVASHARSHKRGRYTTAKEHMPKSHRRYAEWTPSRILGWAERSGPHTKRLAERIMESRPHPEQGFRSCLGILRLGKSHGTERLERACERALAIGSTSYRSVESILKNGLDRQLRIPGEEQRKPPPEDHENVRGPGYYH